MKINATIMAAVLGLASVSLASAQQYIYITGSTAARGAVYNAIAAGLGQDAAPTAVISVGSSSVPANNNYMEFVTTISSTATIIKCAWSGSEAGVIDVSGAVAEPFLLDPGTGSIPSSTTTDTSNPGTANANYFATHTVDMALADNAPLYSKNPTTTATYTGPIVVVPFVFVKNSATALSTLGESDYSSFTNLTTDQFKVLAAGGSVLGLFTGNTNDTSTWVYLTGRDDNSGTRVNVLGETGYGIKTAVNQVILTSAGAISGGAYTSQGQSSGGTLAKTLVDTTSPLQTDTIAGKSGFTVVSYLGMADDATAENLTGGAGGSPTPPAIRLSYNGVAYSTNAVQNGTYAIWGNEYIGFKAGSASYITTFEGKLANKTTGISAYTSGFEIPLGAVSVNRKPSNGPLQSPKY